MAIFRKSALEKLSSPEQLDRMIVITSPGFWIAIVGAAVITVVTLIWSIFGRLPEKISIEGIYVTSTGMHTVYSDTQGVVDNISLSEGDNVNSDSVIISVIGEGDVEQLYAIQSRIDIINDISLYSTDDTVNNDTKNIIDLKKQLTEKTLSDSTEEAKATAELDAAKSLAVNALNDQLSECKSKMKKTDITCKYDGVISEIDVEQGSSVSAGTELFKIRESSSSDPNVVVCYVPVSTGKKITKGMDVIIYPSTVSNQEYGHMEATVRDVEENVATAGEMKDVLGADSLVNSFSSSGPVIAVTCEIKKDASTLSGYYWSSPKGSDIVLTEDTIVTADIITDERAPITMLMPFLKETMTAQNVPSESVSDNG
jgi:HlyD family secretion protein